MKKLLTLCLCCALALPLKASAYSYGLYAEDNPFVEAMLRMMEIFGLIDRSRLPLSAPYLPSYGQQLTPALGGMYGFGGYPGMSPMSGLGGFPAVSPMSGLGGLPGAGTMPGVGGWPGGGFPGAGGVPGNWPRPAPYGPGAVASSGGYLDGAWELNKGGIVVIRGNLARLYLSRQRYQDFTIRYDRSHLLWAPQTGGTTSRYRYQVSDGRMILRDNEGNYLLLRRRR